MAVWVEARPHQESGSVMRVIDVGKILIVGVVFPYPLFLSDAERPGICVHDALAALDVQNAQRMVLFADIVIGRENKAISRFAESPAAQDSALAKTVKKLH